MGKLNRQNLANTAWPFAAVYQSEKNLLSVLARVTEPGKECPSIARPSPLMHTEIDRYGNEEMAISWIIEGTGNRTQMQIQR